MSNFDYEILTADKPEGVTLDQARDAIALQYPDHHVVVEENGDEFVATLARKSRVSRTVVAADDDAVGLLDDAPPAPNKKELPDESDSEDGPPEDKKPSKEEKPDGEKKDEGEGDELSKAMDVVKTLEKVLPKLKSLLGVGDDLVDTPLKGDEGLGPMPPPHQQGPVGPTPGAPPETALGGPGGPPAGPGGPGLGGPPRPPRRPPVPGPGAPGGRGAVPTFSKRQNKVVYRPITNEDGVEVPIDQALAEVKSHPRYADYEVVDVRKDGQHYAAHLKLREE